MIEADLVLRSIGYRTVPIEGVPFDPATSTLNNIAGQVVHPSTGEVAKGEYVAGWAKRGPTGRIGNNKPDSASTWRPWSPACPPSRASPTTSATPPGSRPCCAAAMLEVIRRGRE